MAFPVIQSGLSGLAVGDLIIIVGAAQSAAEPNIAVVGATGFTTVQAQQPGGGSGTAIYYKYANAADVTNVGSIGLTYDNGTSTASVLNSKLFRVTSMVPNATLLTSFANSTSATPTTASITPLLQDLLLIITASASNSSRTVSAQAIASNNPVWTELVDSTLSGTGGGFNANVSLAYAGQIAAANVATGVGSATISGTVGTGTIALIAIQPAPTVSPAPITFAGTLNNVMFMRKMLVSAIAGLLHLNNPVTSEVINKWKNDTKPSVATIVNDVKT